MQQLELLGALHGALSILRARPATVLRLLYGVGVPGPWTVGEVGVFLGVTAGRVRQLEQAAIRTMRNARNRRGGAAVRALDEFR